MTGYIQGSRSPYMGTTTLKLKRGMENQLQDAAASYLKSPASCG